MTLPLIWARQEDPELESAELRDLDAAAAEAMCDRIAATGALERVREIAGERVAAAKEVLRGEDFSDDERRLLALIADGMVERYS